MASGDVEVGLTFLKKLELYDREKPFEIYMEIPPDAPDQRRNNTEYEVKSHTIRDIRGRENEFSLDEQGFAIRAFSSKLDLQDSIDRQSIENVYLPEVEDLIRYHIDEVDQVFFFEWRLRSGDVQIKEGDVIDMNDLENWITPAQVVHVGRHPYIPNSITPNDISSCTDQSPRAVLHRVQLHMKDEANSLLRGQVRVINVWKPLKNPVEDYPLAVCDSSSMALDDLIESDHIRKRFTGATLYAHYNSNQKWYYLSQQRLDEALIMKIFDSQDDVKGKRCPHSAFKHPKYQEGLPSRKSIEVRALVFSHSKT